MNSQTFEHTSECFVKPHHMVEEAKQPIYLGPLDLTMLPISYMRTGLLFRKPPFSNDEENPMKSLLKKLESSLAITLVHFYPLAGRLTTLNHENSQTYSVYIDCNNSPGARLVHKSVNLTISNIISPADVPGIVQSFFGHDKAISSDGHTLSLLTLQVTELLDGVFIGVSLNHSVADGVSFWHFVNTLSEVFEGRAGGQSISTINISRPPIHSRWFPDGNGPIIWLPVLSDFNQTTSKLIPSPIHVERIFHFSATTLTKIKARANAERNTTNIISTLQALIALIWRCVTRVRRVPHGQITRCKMAIDTRPRLYPPLSRNYVGNATQTIGAKATAGELLVNELGWGAGLLNPAVVKHDDKAVRECVELWLKKPSAFQVGQLMDAYSIIVGGSPRFDMYGAEFGLGKAVAIRSGNGNKFDGKVTLFPGREGGGSIDLGLCLSPSSMSALECDEEFLDAVRMD